MDVDRLESLDASLSHQSNILNHAKLTVFQTSLALIATNVGAGIVAMPYAFYHLGLPLGIVATTVMAFAAWMAVILMLKAKDLSPRHYESIYELGYLLMGRTAIFAICTVVLVQAVGLLMVYYILFADTMSELFTQMVTGPDIAGIQTPEQVAIDLEGRSGYVRAFCSRGSFVVLAAIALAPVLFKKEMREMTAVSYLLFAAVITVILVTGYDLATADRSLLEAIDVTEVMNPHPGHGLISALAIVSLAFVFHF